MGQIQSQFYNITFSHPSFLIMNSHHSQSVGTWLQLSTSGLMGSTHSCLLHLHLRHAQVVGAQSQPSLWMMLNAMGYSHLFPQCPCLPRTPVTIICCAVGTGEGRTGVGGERGIFLMRDVEGQGIRQMRSSGKGQASSIIWRMIPAERASRNTLGSHLHAFRRRGRRSWVKPSSVCMTWPGSRSGSTARISMSVLVFSVWGTASPGSLDFRLHAFNFVNCNISGPPIRPVPKSDDQLALPNFPLVPLQCVFGKFDGRYRRCKALDGHKKRSHGC